MSQTNQEREVIVITHGPWTMENGTQYALVTTSDENKKQFFWIKKPASPKEATWIKSRNLETDKIYTTE